MERWMILIMMFFIMTACKAYVLRREPPETASGAIVMALGIFVNGAAYRFPLHETWGPLYSMGLFLIWIFIMGSVCKSILQRQWNTNLVNDPMHFFAAGTWIAGTSVCGIAIARYIPEWERLAWGMAVAAFVLWLFYIVKFIAALRVIWKTDLFRQVHGVVLLPTVSTQSLVICFKTLCGEMTPNWMLTAFIAFGAGLYAIGFILIVKRYALSRAWNIADTWPNTNCILHGAMSITGLACAVHGVIPPNVTVAIWLWVLLWFVIVESVEGLRAALRIKRYGLSGGIGVYHVSQWSRNFTFGMFYAFTYFLDLSGSPLAQNHALPALKSAVIDYGAWVVLTLLLSESLLFFKAKIRWEKLLLPKKAREYPGFVEKIE